MAKDVSSVFYPNDGGDNDPLRASRHGETADAARSESVPTETPAVEARSANVDSSAPRVRVPEVRKLPFKTARELANETPPEMQWTVNGLVAPGLITEVDGKIKRAGKTTWISHEVRAIVEGKPFMDRATTKAKVIWLTEQTAQSFRRVLEKASLTEREDLHILHWHDVAHRQWADIAREAVDYALKVGAGVMIVDTLGQFAGIRGDGENSAGEAQEAMKPLQEAAGRGLSVVLTRHERKSGGAVGESGRGSSAFGGAVDIILSLGRPEGNVRPTIRVIESLSRFDETPDKMFIELTDDGYRSLGDSSAFAEQQAMRAIVDLLPTTEENAMLAKEIVNRLAEQRIGHTVVTGALKKLADSGTIRRVGAGTKGSPFRYWKPLLTEVG